MPYSYKVYPGNGSTTQFAITFPYIRKEHVKVYVNYVDTAYTYVNNDTVQLASAPANGSRVEVRRVTPADNVLVDYADGSTLVAADLDTSNLQHLYLEQELDDALKQSIAIDSATGLPTAGNQRITNVANPANAQDAATKAYVDAFAVAGTIPNADYGDIVVTNNGGTWTIDSLAVTDAKVAAAAAIAGTKISPNFGAQNTLTSGTSTAASFIPTGATVPTNGIYLPAANSVGLATNSVNRITVDSSNNVTIAGAARIKADFTNGAFASRSYFQTSTTNGATAVGALPNGTSNSSGLWAFNNSTPTNAAYCGVVIDGTAAYLRSARANVGTSLPLYIQTGDTPTTRMTFAADSYDITIPSTAQIKGDFSNSLVYNRTSFKTSTANSATYITAFPSGTSQESGFCAANQSYDSTTFGSSLLYARIDSAKAYIDSTATGVASALDLNLCVGGVTSITLDSFQNVLIGVATANSLGGLLQLNSGITFPATRVASSDPNTLDEYEEGTWTPTIVGVATAGAGMYTTQVGRYTRIGNVVTAFFNLNWSAHTGVGNMTLAGLPVASANVTNLNPLTACYANNLTVTGTVFCNVTSNSTNALFYAVNNGTATALAMDTAPTQIAGTITYYTA